MSRPELVGGSSELEQKARGFEKLGAHLTTTDNLRLLAISLLKDTYEVTARFEIDEKDAEEWRGSVVQVALSEAFEEQCEHYIGSPEITVGEGRLSEGADFYQLAYYIAAGALADAGSRHKILVIHDHLWLIEAAIENLRADIDKDKVGAAAIVTDRDRPAVPGDQ